MKDPEIVLGRFHRLIQDFLRGGTERTCFEPWEIELLLDIEDCRISKHSRRAVLQRYQRAVERQLDYGQLPPMKLSEYLESC